MKVPEGWDYELDEIDAEWIDLCFDDMYPPLEKDPGKEAGPPIP